MKINCMKKNLFYPVIILFAFLLSSSNPKLFVINIPITSGVSLMRIGIDPHPQIEGAKTAAQMVWDAIENNDMERFLQASYMYDTILQKTNQVGDLSALKWLCDAIAASETDKKVLLKYPLNEEYYRFFTDSSYLNLKDYLLREYKINDYNPTDPEEHLKKRMYLEDMIMFNNPLRDEWEKSNEIIKLVPIKKGSSIIDIGCGFGFYSARFSDIVGSTGKVFAVDTYEPYVDYFKQFVQRYHKDNIFTVVSKITNVSVNEPVDVAFMSSVYHIVYGWSKEEDRTAFLNSLIRILKKGGYLVIADNSYLNGDELNNCYLNKELIISQLAFYGFTFKKYYQITPQRYVLIFKYNPGEIKEIKQEKIDQNQPHYNLEVSSGNSVIHIGSLDSYDITDEGIAVAKMVLNALQNKSRLSADSAIKAYNKLVTVENFGGEYSALQWFCEYILNPEEKKVQMESEPLIQAYYDYLGGDDYKLLREYVKYKYRIGKEENSAEDSTSMREEDREIGRTRRAFLEDFILFNNPNRENWENTSKIMNSLNIQEGMVIADVGCGSGYYSNKFSRAVGPSGKIYAIDIKEDHLKFINNYTEKNNITNIQTILAKDDDIQLDTNVDYVFMCSLYHIIYGVYNEKNRASMIESIKKIMTKESKLIIVDNGPVEDQTLPYHGPYITKELIEYQLAFYGFKLIDYEQIIPQRYMLTFQLME